MRRVDIIHEWHIVLIHMKEVSLKAGLILSNGKDFVMPRVAELLIPIDYMVDKSMKLSSA